MLVGIDNIYLMDHVKMWESSVLLLQMTETVLNVLQSLLFSVECVFRVLKRTVTSLLAIFLKNSPRLTNSLLQINNRKAYNILIPQ
jgi:hypothetical protein